MNQESNPLPEQISLPGCITETTKEKLDLLAGMPLRPVGPQQKCDHGLFDEVMRRQQSLF